MRFQKSCIVLLMNFFVFDSLAMNNSYYLDPAFFLEMMQECANEKLEYGLNFYDEQKYLKFFGNQVEISESNIAPEGAQYTKDNVRYYHFKMSSTLESHEADCWLIKDESGNVIDSGWVKNSNNQNLPVFVWYPVSWHERLKLSFY